MGNDIRSVLDAIAGSWVPKAAFGIFALLLVVTAAIGVTQNTYEWANATPPGGITTIDVGRMGVVIGTSGTATAFLVTLYVADRKYLRSREHIPHLSMDLVIQRAPVSQSYDVVIVTLNATNTGTGLCTVRQVDWTIKVVSPYDDDSIQGMQQEFDDHPTDLLEIEFPWHQDKHESTVLDLTIEPNETEQITQDFIIVAEIEAIIVSAWVPNASEPKETEGWYRRTLHGQGDLTA